MNAPASSFSRRQRKRKRQPPELSNFFIETDLPIDIPIGPQELTAIERLLGTDLDEILRENSNESQLRKTVAE